jgi:hypothetical protein
MIALLLASSAWVSAVVVGHNGTIDPALAPLRYADDDAVRTFEILDAYADRVDLLTAADRETQERHRGAFARALAPTRAELFRALGAAFDEIQKARAAGRRTVFYFFYSGHGSIGAGRETYVHLADGPWTRADLYRHVIARSPADRTHIVIDACNAYFLVHKRGDEALEAVRRLVAAEDLEKYPQTGVILSTASEADTQEWDRFGAGIFSHVLRSALAGAADADDDQRITYDEAESFFRSAVALVPDARARPEPWMHAPRLDRDAPLVELSRGRFGAFLRLGAEDAGRFWLVDERNVRYLDFNKARGHEVSLALLGPRRYFVQTRRGEAMIDVPPPAPERPRYAFRELAFAAGPGVRERGGSDQMFRLFLFAQEFGPAFHRGFVAARREAAVAAPQPVRGRVLVSAGLAGHTGLGGVGAVYRRDFWGFGLGSGFFAISGGPFLFVPLRLAWGPLELQPYAELHGAFRPRNWLVTAAQNTRIGALGGVEARLFDRVSVMAGAGAHYVLFNDDWQFFAELSAGVLFDAF